MSDEVLTDAAENAVEAAAFRSSPLVHGSMRHVPFRVSAVLRLCEFRLKDLNELRDGRVLMTDTSATDDVPVFVAGVTLAFAELDDVDGQMAVRLTRLS